MQLPNFRRVCLRESKLPQILLRQTIGLGVRLVPAYHLQEMRRPYPASHKPWLQQLLDQGWVITNEDPRPYIKCDCIVCWKRKRAARQTNAS